MKVSVFRNALSVEPVHTDISVILNHIKTGYWSDKIAHLRSLDKFQYDEQKKGLPAITFSGTFTKRSIDGLDKYSGIVCLDIDKLEFAQVKNLNDQLKNDPRVYANFTSPSGKGIKILVKVNTGPENHLSAFLHLQKVFEQDFCFKIDDSGKDISRLCFVSYDPEMMIDEGSDVFEVDCRYGEVKKYTPPANLQNYKPAQDVKKIFDLCVSWVEKTSSYTPGQRNRFIHSLACACNRVGLQINDAEGMAKSVYGMEAKELEHCFKSAYFRNQSEHASVEVKDIGIGEFTAPVYVMNYTDDVVVNDIMQITCMLHVHKIPADEIYRIVKNIAIYYHSKGFIDLKRKSVGKIMNEAIATLNSKVAEQADSLALNYQNSEDILADVITMDFDSSAIPTSFKEFDEAMRGGLMPGCFFGLIGVGGTFKSVFAEFLAFITALNGKPVLYLNGEMTKFQYYERLALMTMNAKIYELMQTGKLNKDTMGNFIKEMNDIIHNNLFFVSGSGFNQENILATIANIKAKTGKEVALVVIDGLTQMDQKGLQEIPATINNTAVCKEVAKNANDGKGVVVLGLLHISGENDKTFRDTGLRCRGGIKSISNMDGYFSTSLIVDPSNNSLDKQGTEIEYTKGLFYLKFTDKRGNAGVVNAIIKVNEDLRLNIHDIDAGKYEVKL